MFLSLVVLRVFKHVLWYQNIFFLYLIYVHGFLVSYFGHLHYVELSQPMYKRWILQHEKIQLQ